MFFVFRKKVENFYKRDVAVYALTGRWNKNAFPY